MKLLKGDNHMKKVFAIAALAAVTSLANAASVTIEGQMQKGDHGARDSNNYALSVKESFNKTFAGDIEFTAYQQDGTKALSNRLEAGVTGSMPVRSVNLYTRVAVGEKFTNGANFGYYSVEPGVVYNFTNKLSGKVGYRFRNGFGDNGNLDTTHTARAGVSYAITKNDSIGVRYDLMRGDSFNHSYNLAYTHSF
jgi:long-subunit fatty acid transport protein